MVVNGDRFVGEFRLEHAELTSQTAARRRAVRGRVIGFVRAGGLPVLGSPACIDTACLMLIGSDRNG